MSKARLGRKRFSPMCMLMVVIAVIGAPLAQAAQFTVEAVKAAYLFRFAQYVEWPSLAADSPFVIAVSGAEDVAVHLERLLPGMSVNGHRVVVRRVTRAAGTRRRTHSLHRRQSVCAHARVAHPGSRAADSRGHRQRTRARWRRGHQLHRSRPQSAIRDLADCRGPQRTQDQLAIAVSGSARRAPAAGRINCVDGYPTDSAPMSATSGWPA